MATPCDIVMFVQLKQLMIVGIDCYHDTAAGKRSIGALVASLNQSMSRLVSVTELGIHTGSSAMLSVMFNMCKQGLTWRFLCVCVCGFPAFKCNSTVNDSNVFQGGSQSVCCSTKVRRSWMS